jgi:hypothetical protein
MAGTLPKYALACAALFGLGACLPTSETDQTSGLKPHARPAASALDLTPAPSASSRALQTYYARVEADLLSQGLLRTDGGGPDTPFDARSLTLNFERIALRDEYARGRGYEKSDDSLGPVKKWQRPVRVAAEFGASVRADQRAADTATLANYVARLARVTGHSISMVDTNPNFVVMFVGEDDRQMVAPRVLSLVPNANRNSLKIFDHLPKDIHCLVVAFSSQPASYDYGKAVAVIRSEHPDLLRKSCIHEEVAQGLGLGNDSPRARPSIFNDDDEFALLTSHDEYLLRILYNPRLAAGMTAQTARPIVRNIADALMGGPS